MIFVGNRDNDAKGRTGSFRQAETFIEELVPIFIGLALCQSLMDFIIGEHLMDIDRLDNFCQETAFKLDWKWMIR